MARQVTEFDAQCDLAALVYCKPDEPDRLLQEFMQDLTIRGYRVVGLIQTRLDDGGAAVTVLPTGETIPLAQRRPARAHSSPPYHCDLTEAATRVDALIEAGADLVIINRFGKLEAEGTGLVDEIARALTFDIPVVVAVPEFRFSEWLSFCRGMGVKLQCRNGSLQSWWSAMIVGGQTSARRRRVSFCERTK
jgi:nucleoside-triphosphatase THEP1